MLGVVNIMGVPLATPQDAWNWWYQGAFSQNAPDLPTIQAQYAAAMVQAGNTDPAAIAQGQAQIALVYNQVQSGQVLPSDQPSSDPTLSWLVLALGVGAVVVGVAIVK